MASAKLICTVAVLANILWGQIYSYTCKSDTCANVVCPEIKDNCKNGRLMKKGDTCSCCDLCIQYLAKNASCLTTFVGQLPTEECGPDLTCDQSNFVCVEKKTTCLDAQKWYDDLINKGNLMPGDYKPDCDEYGYYRPVQCSKNGRCYCVDKDGERLFGTVIATEKNTTDCGCSRDLQDLLTALEMTEYLHPLTRVMAFTEPQREILPLPDPPFPMCNSTGAYQTLQRHGEIYFCVNGSTGQPDGGRTVPQEMAITLPCYDPNINNDDLDEITTRPCHQELEYITSVFTEMSDASSTENLAILGVNLPNCAPDGYYAPEQCDEHECFCVDANRTLLSQFDNGTFLAYSVPRFSEDAYILACQCALELEYLRRNVANVFNPWLPDCDKNGNYVQKQRKDELYYCVDTITGQQTSEEKVNPDDLTCPKTKWHPTTFAASPQLQVHLSVNSLLDWAS